MYISTALYCAYVQEQGYDFIMLHHASQFEIAILSHTSLVEGIRASLMKRSTRGQDMCTVADTYSYIHSVLHHWVIKAVRESFTDQIAPKDRSVPKYIIQIRRYIGSPCYVG